MTCYFSFDFDVRDIEKIIAKTNRFAYIDKKPKIYLINFIY